MAEEPDLVIGVLIPDQLTQPCSAVPVPIEPQKGLDRLRELLECPWVDAVTIGGSSQLAVWVDDEGWLNGRPPNYLASIVAQTQLFGPAVVTGWQGVDIAGLPQSWVDLLVGTPQTQLVDVARVPQLPGPVWPWGRDDH